MRKAVLEALHNFFGKNIDFKVTSKLSNGSFDMLDDQELVMLNKRDELMVVKDKIERLLRYATSEYKKAKKLFKRGEITIDELIENEEKLNKLRNELDEINFKLRQ